MMPHSPKRKLKIRLDVPVKPEIHEGLRRIAEEECVSVSRISEKTLTKFVRSLQGKRPGNIPGKSRDV